jgi:cutinase
MLTYFYFRPRFSSSQDFVLFFILPEMRFLTIAPLVTAVLASPQGKGKVNPGGTPGNRGPNLENELTNGGCRDIFFIMARASSERGNMVHHANVKSVRHANMQQGGSMGPIVCRGLREAYGKQRVGCQGVGPKYTAAMGDNGRPKGTSDVAIQEAQSLFKLASTKCPNAIIVFGGYRSELSCTIFETTDLE